MECNQNRIFLIFSKIWVKNHNFSSQIQKCLRTAGEKGEDRVDIPEHILPGIIVHHALRQAGNIRMADHVHLIAGWQFRLNQTACPGIGQCPDGDLGFHADNIVDKTAVRRPVCASEQQFQAVKMPINQVNQRLCAREIPEVQDPSFPDNLIANPLLTPAGTISRYVGLE